MHYFVKNISTSDIIIGNESLSPNKEIPIKDLKPFETMIKMGYVTVRTIDNNEKNIQMIEASIDNTNNNLKQSLIESFFGLYLDKNVNSEQLELLKSFYKKIGFTNKINYQTLSLLDSVNNHEELIEVLLNNVYPALLDLYIDEDENK